MADSRDGGDVETYRGIEGGRRRRRKQYARDGRTKKKAMGDGDVHGRRRRPRATCRRGADPHSRQGEARRTGAGGVQERLPIVEVRTVDDRGGEEDSQEP